MSLIISWANVGTQQIHFKGRIDQCRIRQRCTAGGWGQRPEEAQDVSVHLRSHFHPRLPYHAQCRLIRPGSETGRVLCRYGHRSWSTVNLGVIDNQLGHVGTQQIHFKGRIDQCRIRQRCTTAGGWGQTRRSSRRLRPHPRSHPSKVTVSPKYRPIRSRIRNRRRVLWSIAVTVAEHCQPWSADNRWAT